MRSMMRRGGFYCGLAAAFAGVAPAATLVEDGRPAAVIVIHGDGPSRAAVDLQRYVEKVSGARLPIVDERKLGAMQGVTSRVFVGAGEAASRGVDFSRLQPEGFVIKTVGDDLFIVGRDHTEAGTEVQGTFHGVCEFLERYLGVRWLMPGPVGEVTPRQPTLRIGSADIRQEPLLWQRKIREVRTTGHREAIRGILEAWGVPVAEWEAAFAPGVTDPWFDHQRLGTRVSLQFGHSFAGWWDKYHEQYPDIFALQPNGTRLNSNERERLCVSNPVLWDLVAKERVAELRANPRLSGVSIAPNDGGGGNRFCSCARCRAWDPPAAQALYQKDPHLNPGPGGVGPFPPLSDRFFRFFNEVAKRVKQELPDRYLGTYAYSLYRTPPAALDRLEDNLVVGYVGPNSMVSDQQRETARREFAEWSQKAKQLMLRPNLLASPLGLPVVYVHRLAEDMRFFVGHGMRLTDFASCFGNWGTQGLNYYVLAKLLWDPYQPVDPIIDDYCRAAYGAGAQAVKEYYRRAEEFTNRMAAASPVSPQDNTTTDFYTEEELARQQAPLDRAAAVIGRGDPAATERVRMLQTGLEYARQTRRLMSAAAEVRARRMTRAQFAEVAAAVIPFYRSLAMDWAVAAEQNYRRIKMGLSLNPGRRAVAADADDP